MIHRQCPTIVLAEVPLRQCQDLGSEKGSLRMWALLWAQEGSWAGWTLLWAQERTWAEALLCIIRINLDIGIERAVCDACREMCHLSTNSSFNLVVKKNRRRP
jgi:hypothetical protein